MLNMPMSNDILFPVYFYIFSNSSILSVSKICYYYFERNLYFFLAKDAFC